MKNIFYITFLTLIIHSLSYTNAKNMNLANFLKENYYPTSGSIHHKNELHEIEKILIVYPVAITGGTRSSLSVISRTKNTQF